MAIAENQPIGTIVGEFNATDPDSGATLAYQLVSGGGDGNNTLFTLDANGTLRTATTFDFESNASTYSIRVQAKDELNATVEGNFTVTLTDWFDGIWNKVTAPDKSALEQFGKSVSKSGNLLAVGAQLAVTDGVETGAVYLYRMEVDGSSTFLSKVTAPDKAFGNQFGFSVSLSSDLLIVGSYLSDPSGISDAGASYLYRVESNGSATFLNKIMAPDQASGDYFGRAVSISGNLIGVGAHTADPNGVTNGGSVYLYRLESNGSLSFLNKVIAHDISAEDEFGVDLSLYDNLLLIGSRKADPNGFTNGGAAYLYRVEQNGSVSLLEKIVANDIAANDWFGRDVSQYGNFKDFVGASSSDPGLCS